MNRRIAVVVLALVLAPAATCFAGIDNAGTTAANFLSVGSGASALGMAGASLGYASDLSSASWNVAALGKFDQTQVLFSHAGLSEASAQEWAAVGGRYGARTHWGVSGLYQGEGSIAGRDVFGNSTGNFSTASTALGFSAARAVNSNVVVGAGFKWVNESLGDGVSGMGVGFDAGVLVQSGRYGFGAALQNVGGKMNYAGQKYPMPANYGLGVSVSDPTYGLRVALDLNFPSAYYSDARVGVEWRYRDWLALRTGYRKELGSEAGEPLGGPTFGMGAGANGFWFDYGYVVGASTGASEHRIGLTFKPAMMNFGGGSAVGDASPAPAPAPKPAAASAEKPKKKSTPESNATASRPWYEKPAKTSDGAVAKAAPSATPTTIEMPTLDSAPPREATPATKAAPAKATPTKSAPAKSAAAVGIPIAGIPIAPSAKPMAPAAPIATSAAPVTSPVAVTAKATTPVETPKPAIARPAAVATPTTTVTAPVETPKPAATSATTPSAAAPATKPETAPAPATVAPTQKTPIDAPTPDAATPAAPTPAAPTPAAPTPAAATPASATPVSATPVSPTPAASPASTAAPVAAQPTATPSAPVAVLEPPAPSHPTPAPIHETPAPKPAVATPATPKPAVAASEAKPQVPPAPRPERATVKKGQTLADFAKEWGTTAAAIMMENNLVTERVKPGTTLKLPKK